MLKAFAVVVSTFVFLTAVAGTAFSFGENILAATGQYTFFIKPDPCSPTTYYQKMVPCVAKDVVMVPKRAPQTYPVPVPRMRNVPTVISETPVGAACGAAPCVECFPQPSSKRGSREMILPRMVPVTVPGVEYVPREITRRVTLPQWFAVTEDIKPPRQVQKVR